MAASIVKNTVLAIGVFLILIVVVLVWQLSVGLKKPEVKIGDHVFAVDMADTGPARSLGLSGRRFLPENRGMLFVFDSPGYYSFWMRGMKFPLDIVWIAGDQVVGFAENLTPDDSDNPAQYAPPEPVDKVLEINAGLVQKLGIKVDDAVSY